jgi:flagellar biosynthetic protein FlhB
VAHSQETASALVLFVLLLTFFAAGGSLSEALVEKTRQWLSCLWTADFDQGFLVGLWRSEVLWLAGCAGPLLVAAAAAGLVGSAVPGGVVFAPKAVQLKWGNLNPVAGAKRLMSLRSLVRLAVSSAKIVVIAGVAYLYLSGQVGRLAQLQFETPRGVFAGAKAVVFGLGIRIVVLMLLVAAADALYQRWQYLRDLRLTKQELKEELKRHEGDPHVRARIRRAQVQITRSRMLHKVPSADVVVTNPTHLAVALRYDRRAMRAPTVVAKGADLLARRIVEIACRHQVPVVRRASLAQVLYRVVEVGREIPAELYYAVAEVLAVIFKARGAGVEKT